MKRVGQLRPARSGAAGRSALSIVTSVMRAYEAAAASESPSARNVAASSDRESPPSARRAPAPRRTPPQCRLRNTSQVPRHRLSSDYYEKRLLDATGHATTVLAVIERTAGTNSLPGRDSEPADGVFWAAEDIDKALAYTVRLPIV
jgi:hypothetical protein